MPRSACAAAGFDFIRYMRLLCHDMAQRLPEFSHVDLSHVAMSYSQTRKAVSHGVWATLTPMRFEDGSRTCERDGKTWTVQRLTDETGREMLYILTFYLPRFLNLSLEEKLSTILHELWHISPLFNGDLRRHAGRCFAHGASQEEYDEKMQVLLQKWLASEPPEQLYDAMRLSFAQLRRRYGAVLATRIRNPKLIPLAPAA